MCLLPRPDIEQLISVYAKALADHGATPKGVLWPNATDLPKRFRSLLRPIDFGRYSPSNRLRLLDLGCGPGFLLDYLAQQDLLERVDYCGVDVYEQPLELGRARWPDHRFERRDVRDQPFEPGAFDYCVVCGVFTGRLTTTYETMEAIAQETLRAVWPSVHIGLGFNTMSKHVDWERDDLFHWPLDDIMAFCKKHLARHVSLHLDYGLWETTVLVLREPALSGGTVPASWISESLA